MEFFIQKVKLYPCLWNMNHISYRDNGTKDAAWERIAVECGIANGSEAKLQWKKIRDCHREALRRRKTLNIKPWRYETLMEFLLPQIENRGTTTSNSKNPQGSANNTLSTENKNIVNTYVDTASSPPKNRLGEIQRKGLSNLNKILLRKDKRREQRQRERDEYRRRLVDIDRIPRDALKSLFDSFCQKTRELPKHLQLRVQRELFEAITRAEEEAMTFETNKSYSRCSSSASYEYTSANPSNLSVNDSPVPQTSPTYARSEPEVSLQIKEDVLTDSD